MNIRKTCNTLAALALWLGAAVALADPPAQVGRLTYLTGTVSFAPADAPTEWVAAPTNRPITSGDRLWVDNNGRAEMRIGSTAIRMAALTSMDVLRLDEFGAQLRLAQGTLNVHLRQLDAGDSFEISTPSGAVLLTQPGSYRVNVDPAGTTTAVLVRRGLVDVLTSNAPYNVREGQLSFFSVQGQETYAAPAPDEFDNWAFTRDRQEERIVATRYVPQEMTGYEDLDQHGTWRSVPQYGTVWVPTAVAADWAPYRQGHWVWISPWGWTWVDEAPWGFAPYHYGRWVWLGNHWAWSPGARVARPVYAPALVAFVGGANWSVGVRGGPAVGWVPLGWQEPYIPWYRHSPRYVRNVNVTHVTNVTVINHYTNVNNVTRIRYVNRDVPSGTTVVARDTFTSARRVRDAALHVPGHVLANARVAHEAPVAHPERASLAATRPSTRVPAAIAAREVMAVTAPPAAVAPVVPVVPVVRGTGTRDGNPGRAEEHERRVRVIGAQQRNAGFAPPKAADAPPQPVVDRTPPAPPVATVAPPPTPVVPVAPVAPATQAAPVAPATPTTVERRGPPREPRVNPAPAPIQGQGNTGFASPKAADAPPQPVVDRAPPVATVAPPPTIPAAPPAPTVQAAPVAPPAPTAVERRGLPREPRVNPAQPAAPAAAPAPVLPPVDVQAQQRQARQQADAQAQQQRQVQIEQQRQAHQQQQVQLEQQRQAQQQQARLQAQKEQQHQLAQQRAQQVQQQREQQNQQAQQVDQQRQLRQQQQQPQQAQRQAERAEKQRRVDAQPQQTPPAQQQPR